MQPKRGSARMVEAQEKHISISQVWRFLASMRVGLVLMFLLAGAASLGVLLPQGTTAVDQQDVFSKIKVFLGINQIFATWWFKVLACLLGINVIACVFNRTGAVLHVFRYPHMRVNAFERLKFNDTFTLKAGIHELTETVSQALLASRYRVMQSTEDEQVLFYGDKHRLAVLGPIIAHLGTLILLAGVVWGSFAAYEGEVSAVPGASFLLSKIATHRIGNLIDPDFKIQVNEAKTPSVQSEPKGNLSFVEDGTVALTGDVGFNSPLTYKNVSIYLVKFVNGVQVNINYQGKTTPVILTATGPNHTQVPGNEKLMLLWSNVNPLTNRPSVDFRLVKGTLETGTTVLQQGRLSTGTVTSSIENLTVSLEGYRGITILRAVKNPGLGLVLGGAFLLVLGMFISLMLSYRKIWVSLVQEGEQVLVSAGGYGKLKLDFEVEFNSLLEDIKGNQGG
jgi:cytochrome c biogenesis protein